MINSIHVANYRKFHDIDVQFSMGINLIAGTNGTCKSSLLYLVSNSFKKIDRN